MKLNDALTPELIKLDLGATSREEAIRELVGLLAKEGRIDSGEVDAVTEAIMKREHLGSTAIGRGVAIPHAKARAAHSLVAAFGRSKEGIEFAAVDGQPVHLIFLLASPPDSQRAHLKALAHISRLMMKHDLHTRILEARDANEVLSVIAEGEA